MNTLNFPSTPTDDKSTLRCAYYNHFRPYIILYAANTPPPRLERTTPDAVKGRMRNANRHRPRMETQL